MPPRAPAVVAALAAAVLWDRRWERLPAAVYACDAEGRIAGYNARAARLWGRAPARGDPAERFCGAHRLHRAGRPIRHDESPMAEALRRAAPVDDAEVTLERRDGSRVTVRVRVEPIRDERGRLVGAIGCLDDISARERWYRDVLDALPAAIYTTDQDGRITFYNQAAVEFSGRRPTLGADDWCVTWRLYRPDGTPLPHDQCPMAIALKEGRPIRDVEAVAERPDGTRVPFIPYPTPLRDAAGAVSGAVNMLVDISERKQAEARQRALLDEVNHRVKNTLSTVQSLASLTLRGSGVPPEIRDAFVARLMALSGVHNQLARAQWEAADLRALLDDVFAPYQEEMGQDGTGQHGTGGRIALAGEPVRLSAKAALTLALVLHELATNAIKHGSLSRPGGDLAVSWAVIARGERRLKIEWRESGGPAVRPPERRGFGSRLLEQSVGRGLKGTVELSFAPAGVVCTIDIPLASPPP